jgi:hypothetical protein
MQGEVYLWSKYNHLKIQKRMQINYEDAYMVGYEGVRVYDLIEGRKTELWIKTKGKKEVYDIIL